MQDLLLELSDLSGFQFTTHLLTYSFCVSLKVVSEWRHNASHNRRQPFFVVYKENQSMTNRFATIPSTTNLICLSFFSKSWENGFVGKRARLGMVMLRFLIRKVYSPRCPGVVTFHRKLSQIIWLLELHREYQRRVGFQWYTRSGNLCAWISICLLLCLEGVKNKKQSQDEGLSRLLSRIYQRLRWVFPIKAHGTKMAFCAELYFLLFSETNKWGSIIKERQVSNQKV